MIEMIYNEEGESLAEEKALAEPKNIKQVGLPGEFKKIFVEDFVHTYLWQYSRQKGEKPCVAILLGDSKRAGGKRHIYIKSAFPIEGVTERQGKYEFSENVWGDIYLSCGKYFPEQEIVGWFLSRPGFAVEKNTVIEETHRTYFSGAEKLLFLVEPLEGDSAFFGFDGNRFSKQSGYYIYYEKNEAMRECMLDKNESRRNVTANEKPDVAMVNFRKILKEKQEKKQKRKKKAISYGTKVAVAMVLFVGVVALKNQSNEMLQMRQQIGARLETLNLQEAASDEVVVEELSGDVKQQEIFEQSVVQEEVEIISEETVPENELPVTEEENMPESESQGELEEAVAPVYENYIVQAGDTLAKISRDFYGTDEKVSEICMLNEITDGDYIQAGEIILLP